jgi:hypothetical protein
LSSRNPASSRTKGRRPHLQFTSCVF